MDSRGVFWYDIPDDPDRQWTEHQVVKVTDPQCHGGVAAGDLDGDGDTDLTRVDRWLENVDGEGTDWRAQARDRRARLSPNVGANDRTRSRSLRALRFSRFIRIT